MGCASQVLPFDAFGALLLRLGLTLTELDELDLLPAALTAVGAVEHRLGVAVAHAVGMTLLHKDFTGLLQLVVALLQTPVGPGLHTLGEEALQTLGDAFLHMLGAETLGVLHRLAVGVLHALPAGMGDLQALAFGVALHTDAAEGLVLLHSVGVPARELRPLH